MAQEIFNKEFECPGCAEIFNFTNIQRLQHAAVCKKVEEAQEKKEDEDIKPTSSNQKLFKCQICSLQKYLTNIDILKHKKYCKIKAEPNS